jgi:hypothetical protein
MDKESIKTGVLFGRYLLAKLTTFHHPNGYRPGKEKAKTLLVHHHGQQKEGEATCP